MFVLRNVEVCFWKYVYNHVHLCFLFCFWLLSWVIPYLADSHISNYR